MELQMVMFLNIYDCDPSVSARVFLITEEQYYEYEHYGPTASGHENRQNAYDEFQVKIEVTAL